MILLLLLALGPSTDIHVDVIEHNHMESFSQYIFWRWNGQRYEVVAWRIDKGQMVYSGKRLRWTENGKTYTVKAKQLRQTHTLHDPEMYDRAFLDPEQRSGLH